MRWADPGPIHLHLIHKGDEFTAVKSDDGMKWSSPFGPAFEVPGIGPVQIDSVAVHNTNGRYDVVFDESTLTPSTEKKQ